MTPKELLHAGPSGVQTKDFDATYKPIEQPPGFGYVDRVSLGE